MSTVARPATTTTPAARQLNSLGGSHSRRSYRRLQSPKSATHYWPTAVAPTVVLLGDQLAKTRLNDLTVALKPAIIYEWIRVFTRPLHRLLTLNHEITDSIRRQVSIFDSVLRMHRLCGQVFSGAAV